MKAATPLLLLPFFACANSPAPTGPSITAESTYLSEDERTLAKEGDVLLDSIVKCAEKAKGNQEAVAEKCVPMSEGSRLPLKFSSAKRVLGQTVLAGTTIYARHSVACAMSGADPQLQGLKAKDLYVVKLGEVAKVDRRSMVVGGDTKSVSHVFKFANCAFERQIEK